MKPPRFDWLRRWWSYRQARKTCWHHAFRPDETAVSFIRSELIDLGRSKRFWCTECRKVWIV